MGDHRIAMAFAIAALRANEPSEIADAECVGVSYPEFLDQLATLAPGCVEIHE
jgi:3-phosphoshikimate 1-carboxyvinyltransferase